MTGYSSLGFTRYGWVPESWVAPILRLHTAMQAAAGARFVRKVELPRPALSFCSFTSNPRILKGATIDTINADSVTK